MPRKTTSIALAFAAVYLLVGILGTLPGSQPQQDDSDSEACDFVLTNAYNGRVLQSIFADVVLFDLEFFDSQNTCHAVDVYLQDIGVDGTVENHVLTIEDDGWFGSGWFYEDEIAFESWPDENHAKNVYLIHVVLRSYDQIIGEDWLLCQ